MDTGRFERFEKARRQTDRKAVADPGALAQPGGEAQHPRVRQRFAIESGQQFLMRIGIGDEVAGIDQPVARAMLQRNAPLPSGRARGGDGIGCALLLRRGRSGDRAVAGQPALPVLEAGIQRFFHQQPAKTRAVDVEIRREGFAIVELYRGDPFAFAARRPYDPPVEPFDPRGFGVFAQKGGDQPGIEMQRIGDRAARPIAIG